METHDAHADAALAGGGVGGARHAGGGVVDEVLEHVVEETQHVLHEGRMIGPFVVGFEIQRGEAADRRALLAVMIAAGGQGNLGAQVAHFHFQAELLVMLGDGAVHVVDEDDVRFAGLHAGGEQLDP